MIIWLASYPKSGNTLLRSILCSYLFTNDGNFNFELLKYIKQFPSKYFFHKIGVDTENLIEVEKNYIIAQKFINSINQNNFLKTHSSFKLNHDYDFTNEENTLGAIYIVRDPRNVITSISKHYELNLDDALNLMLSSSSFTGDKYEKDTPVFISSWKSNYDSWKSGKFKDKCLFIKYENLVKKKKETIIKVLEFIGNLSNVKFVLNEKKLQNTLLTTEFNYLQKMEKEQGFVEGMIDSKTKKEIQFFNSGIERDWKKLLSDKIVNKIELSFKKEMTELGYL